MSKPMMGAKFREFRDLILNLSGINVKLNTTEGISSLRCQIVQQECVEVKIAQRKIEQT